MATLSEESVDLPTATGPMRVHLYRPASAAPVRFPGLVLYSEIYQETPPIRRSALRFASEGFLVAVPEVFHDTSRRGPSSRTTRRAPTRATATSTTRPWRASTPTPRSCSRTSPVTRRAAGASARWASAPGGHLALRAALNARVLATACFYATDLHGDTLGRGKQSDSLARAGDVRGELMMVWGRQDPHVPAEGRANHARLAEAGVSFAWHEVNAQHAFLRDEGPR